MAYRRDSELTQCFELLGAIDPLGNSIQAEELFPDVADEEERVGVNVKEYNERINSMGFLPCIDGLSPDEAVIEYGDGMTKEDALIRFIDSPREDEEIDLAPPDFYEKGRLQLPYVARVIVSKNRRNAKRIRRTHEFVMLRTPLGAAVFL